MSGSLLFVHSIFSVLGVSGPKKLSRLRGDYSIWGDIQIATTVFSDSIFIQLEIATAI